MFAFFIALMIQALIEREVRQKMKENEIPSLALYPEDRDATHPTTSKIMDLFVDISTYKLMQDGEVIEEFKDDLTKTHKTILTLLDIPQRNFWMCHRKQK